MTPEEIKAWLKHNADHYRKCDLDIGAHYLEATLKLIEDLEQQIRDAAERMQVEDR